MPVVLPTSQDCQENERREGMCRVSAWLAVDLHEGMSWHGPAVFRAEAGRLACPHILLGLEIAGRPCTAAPLEAAGLAPDPQANGHPDPEALRGGQLWDQRALESLLRCSSPG